MRIAHRATDLADAQRAQQILTDSGIPSHIADRELWDHAVLTGTEVIRVMVDNRTEDRARRAMVAGRNEAAARAASKR
jgi:hypothetical protein